MILSRIRFEAHVMAEWKQKRFWTEARAEPEGDGWAVALDGRRVKTPAKAPLVVPTRALADAIAAEWNAQEGAVNPATMPCTRSANAAIDKVAVQKAEVVDMLAAYGDADLLCYRAEGPQELVDRQAAQWTPPLDWAADTFGARLAPRSGIMHQPQDPAALSRLHDEVNALSPFQLAGLHDLVALSGSLVLGLAAARDWRPVDELWDLSRLDDLWQEEHWGRDEDAHALAERKRGEFHHAKRFFDFSTPPAG
jgi:chaperone required for assembly of F1-ATPase